MSSELDSQEREGDERYQACGRGGIARGDRRGCSRSLGGGGLREKSWGLVLVNAWVAAVLLASLYRPTPGRECQPLRRGRARP